MYHSCIFLREIGFSAKLNCTAAKTACGKNTYENFFNIKFWYVRKDRITFRQAVCTNTITHRKKELFTVFFWVHHTPSFFYRCVRPTVMLRGRSLHSCSHREMASPIPSARKVRRPIRSPCRLLKKGWYCSLIAGPRWCIEIISLRSKKPAAKEREVNRSFCLFFSTNIRHPCADMKAFQRNP